MLIMIQVHTQELTQTFHGVTTAKPQAQELIRWQQLSGNLLLKLDIAIGLGRYILPSHQGDLSFADGKACSFKIPFKVCSNDIISHDEEDSYQWLLIRMYVTFASGVICRQGKIYRHTQAAWNENTATNNVISIF